MNVNDLFPAKWLTPADLKGRSAVVEVERVTLEDVFNPRTRQSDKKLAIAFKGARKRMLLNKTQAFAFAAACASTESAHWVGCKVQLSVGIAPNKAETIVVSAPPDLPAPPTPQPPTNGATPPKSARTKTPQPEELITVPVPAVVDAATWEAAQVQLQRNKQFSRRNAKRDYLLRGLVRCRCGRIWQGDYKSHLKRANYRCSSADRGA